MTAMKGEFLAQAAWTNVRHGWHQLYGSFEEMGISIEWHDFKTSRPLDWAESFRPGSVEFCLNLDGRGAIGRGGSAPHDYGPSSSGYYAIGDEPLRATRQANDHHRFVTLEYSRKHLQTQFAASERRPQTGDARGDFPEKRAEHRLAAAADVGRAARDCGQPCRASGAEGGTHSLVSKQGARADVALSFRTEGSGILLHAPKESGA